MLRAPLAELQDSEKAGPDELTLEAANRGLILRVLRETRGEIGGRHGPAVRLGLKRTTLNSKLKRLGIKKADYIQSPETNDRLHA